MIILALVAIIGSCSIVFVFGVVGMITFVAIRDSLGLNLSMVVLLLECLLLIIALQAWIRVTLFYTVKERANDSKVKDLLMNSSSKVGPYFWVVFLKSIIILGGFLLFIIPGIIFSIWFSLAEYAFVFDDKKGMQALWRSKELVQGYWWPVFGRLLALFLLAVFVSCIHNVGFLINFVLVLPFGIIYGYVIYEDLKRFKKI